MLARAATIAAAAGRATRASACAPSAASVWAGCASSTGARRLQSSTSREPSPREYAEDAFEHPDDAPGLRRPKAMEVASSIVSAVKDDQSKHENRVRSRDDCIFAQNPGDLEPSLFRRQLERNGATCAPGSVSVRVDWA
jgi:hypothetical protein